MSYYDWKDTLPNLAPSSVTDGIFRAIGLICSIVTLILIIHLKACQYRFVISTLIFIGFQVIDTISPTSSVYTNVGCQMPTQEAIKVILLPYTTPLLLRQKKQVVWFFYPLYFSSSCLLLNIISGDLIWAPGWGCSS